MANTVDKVVAVAKAEAGYLEKSKHDYLKYGKECLYNKKGYAGSDNYTKYGYEMHELYPSVMDFPAYWCDCFVDWCFYTAYGVANAKGLLGGDFDDYTKGSIALYQKKKAFFKRGEKEPKVGDQVFFSKDNTLNGVHHTGLITGVDVNNIYTTEGNTVNSNEVVRNGGCVANKQYRKNDNRIYGYGRPKYDAEETKLGWVKSGDKWYYRIGPNENAHGWQKIKNADGKTRWYHFQPDGQMDTGMVTIDGNKYYLETSGDLEGACYISDESGVQRIWVV